MESSRVCELCGGDASLYCPSDSAFLCFRCDADVHGANFLVARHIRHPLCSSCRSLSSNGFSGAGISSRPTAACPSCPALPNSDSLSSDSDSDCVSSTGSAAPTKIRQRRRLKVDRVSSLSSLTEDSARFISGEVSSSATRADIGGRRTERSTPAVARIDARAEGILEIWRRRLGLSETSVVDWAARALGSCGAEMPALPLRVLLAASFWLGLRMSGSTSRRRDANAMWQVLIRRLEEVSGVPAKLIVASAANIARAGRARRAGGRHFEEGCAEC